MSNIDWFFEHTALIGVFIAVIISFLVSLLKISDLKKLDYSVLIVSMFVAIANHDF